jgi:CelD/BcsL family acetyltransferase involved in cellulose biosynthesis
MLAPTTALATPSATTGLTIDAIEDVQGFDRLKGEWDALLDASASRTPFLTWGWLRSWWMHLAGSATLHIIVVRQRGELIGIAPMMRTRRGISHASVLEFLGAGAGSDYLDVIVRTGREPDTLDVLASAFDSLQLPLYLDNLPPASAAAQLQSALASTGWTAIDSSPDVCPFINLAGHTWDSYLATLGSAHRANVRRRMRALAAGFEVRFEAVQAEADRRPALTALIELSKQRWAERGGNTAFESPALCAFHDEATHVALADGSLRLYVLSLNGTVAAVMYGFARQGHFYFYQHGFSDEYARFSIGLVLMALTIQAAIAEGLTEFDMLYGHESYKRLWTREERPLGRLQLFTPRISGTLLRREADTRRALRTLAYQLGLKRHEEAQS